LKFFHKLADKFSPDRRENPTRRGEWIVTDSRKRAKRTGEANSFKKILFLQI